MEESRVTNSQNTQSVETSYSPEKQLAVGVAITLFFVVIGIFGYYYFNGHNANQSANDKSVLQASTNAITPIQTQTPNQQSTFTATTNNTPASGPQSNTQSTQTQTP